MPLLLAFLVATASGLDPEIEAVQGRRLTPAERSARRHNGKPSTPPSYPEVRPSPLDPRLEACATTARRDSVAGIAEARAWIAQKDGPDARQCLGLAQAAAGHWGDAVLAFREGARLAGSDAAVAGRLWAQAGNAALAGGDVTGAKSALDQALSGGLPDGLAKGEAFLDRARARVALNDQVGARADLDEALRLASDDPLAWLLSATLARRMNDLPLAQQHIAQAVRRAGDDASVALEEGVIAALSNRDADAKTAFERAQRLAGPQSPIAANARTYLAQLGVGPASKPSTAR